ncbi:MAG: hypothetical protein JRI23_26505 [Deltaproteobacteria bacterium]|jgi:hypothetical protein|nr:hypothetical protein [Deltaproteobacteria bacterium]MBW2535588.1 hypothetical protein [Deltaproteobacteria bacterium]
MLGTRLASGRTAAAVLVALSLLAAEQRVAAEPKRVRVAASKRYVAGRIHRFTFGGGYRDLWKTEIELPVLDLAATGGGLTPKGRFGGLQSAVLAFQGADGRSYSFRGTDKDPSAVLDPMLRDTIVRSLVQDQMAAQHPGGPLVAAVLSEAAGVLTIPERLVVMPDDPALGEYRKEFAGMVGSFYEYPTPTSPTHDGFHGATEIIDQEQLYARLARGHDDQVHATAFLRARLLDLLLGDFDRHRKQWRWARLPGERRWQPVPEDRDQAFVRYDGAGQRLASIYVPILQCYGPDYPDIGGLTLHGWEQDRWLLTGLDWTAWLAVVRELQERLDDATVDRAVQALPPEYVAIDGARLRKDIRGRRDKLPEAARSFYEHLAAEVDVHGTDAAESVHIQWLPDGQLLLEARDAAAGLAAQPVFSRRFASEDTSEVRLYLKGGDDVVKVIGEPGSIVLRVIAEGGKKLLDDSVAGETELYDPAGSTTVLRGPGTAIDRDPYDPPPSDSGFLDVDVPPRDWGGELLPIPELALDYDVGLLIGASLLYTDYGFRKHPWSSRHKMTAAFSTGALLPVVAYAGQYRPQNSAHLGLLDVSYTGIDILRYYGEGNETDNVEDDSFYRVRNQQVTVAPGLAWNFFDEQLRLSARTLLQYADLLEGDRFIDQEAPYGSGNFGHLGATGKVVIDTRQSPWDDSALALPLDDNPAAGYPTRGYRFEAAGKISPPVWDVEELWGSVSGSMATYLATSGGRLGGSLRVGGELTFGETPYFGAAFVGGGGGPNTATARGFAAQRFAGKASAFGNADLRLFLARFTVIVPSDFGLHGFFDVARVFVSGEQSMDWHPSGGGGIWIAPLVRTNTLTVSVAGSDEDVRAYFRAGLHY